MQINGASWPHEINLKELDNIKSEYLEYKYVSAYLKLNFYNEYNFNHV